MPKEVLIEIISERAGVPIGTRMLRFSVDADEYVKLGTAKIVDENPAPRHWMLDKYGVVDPGVLAGSQTKMTPEERKNEQQFLLDQVRALDEKHAKETAEKAAADALAGRRKAVAHE